MIGLPGFPILLECHPDRTLLVGGALRDWHAGREIKDVDLAMDGDPTSLAREFARRCRGSWFWLDEERRQSRVALKLDGSTFCYDFSPLRAPNIETDLADRDFTLNAMAVLLAPGGWELLDPLDARKDIAAKTLRHCSPGGFRDDPLRILRGIRFALQFGFVPAPSTEELMADSSPLLADMPGERIHAELSAVLGLPVGAGLLRFLHKLELSETLFGVPLGDARCHRIGDRLTCLETSGESAAPWVAGLSSEIVANNFSRLAVLKLYLLVDAGQGTDKIIATATRLALGRRISQALAGLRQLRNVPTCPTRERAQRLWLQDLPGDPRVSLCWMLLVDNKMRKEDLELQRLNPELVTADRDAAPQPLLSARALTEKLGIQPGPDMGKAFAELRKMEVADEVSTAEDAEAWLLEWVRKSH